MDFFNQPQIKSLEIENKYIYCSKVSWKALDKFCLNYHIRQVDEIQVLEAVSYHSPQEFQRICNQLVFSVLHGDDYRGPWDSVPTYCEADCMSVCQVNLIKYGHIRCINFKLGNLECCSQMFGKQKSLNFDSFNVTGNFELLF